MPRKAVIYARFSCNRQREASIEDQLRVCREWCPVCIDSRTEICAVGTVVLLRIPRAA